MGLKKISIAIALSCSWASWAYADIYKFVDENNVAHFHNLPQNSDPRYKLYLHEGTRKARVKIVVSNKFNALNRKRFTPIIASMAQRYRIDETLLHAVIMAESGYNPNAISPKGAVGLMQLMPATAKRYGVTHITDPTENILGGTRYLRDLLKMFKNDLHLAVAAYNCGENAVISFGNKIPPYEETVNYVAKVLASYKSSKVKSHTVFITPSSGLQDRSINAQITSQEGD